MHESEDRGRLLLNGKPMSDEALARLLGLDKQVLLKTLAALLDFGVATREPDGTLINRRMVKDEAERKANAERQRKFYGKNKPNAEPNGQPNANLTAIQQKSNTPSSSSSSEKETTNVVSKKTSRASRLPEDFTVTDAMQSWAAENTPRIDLAVETENFKDDALAKDKAFKDWAAAWRTWMRNAEKWLKPDSGKKSETGAADGFVIGYVEPDYSKYPKMAYGSEIEC